MVQAGAAFYLLFMTLRAPCLPVATMVATLSRRYRQPLGYIFLVGLFPKPFYFEPNFEGIYPGIRKRKSGIGDVEVAGFQAPGVFLAEKMRPERRRRREVHLGCSRRHLLCGEQSSAAEFQVRHNPPAS